MTVSNHKNSINRLFDGHRILVMREGAAAEQNLTAIDAAVLRRTEEEERCGFSSCFWWGLAMTR